SPSSQLAALFSGEPFLPASAPAWRLGALTRVGPDELARFLRGQPLAGSVGYTGHLSLLGCDVRALPYPPLHRGGSPPRNPKKRQESNSGTQAEAGSATREPRPQAPRSLPSARPRGIPRTASRAVCLPALRPTLAPPQRHRRLGADRDRGVGLPPGDSSAAVPADLHLQRPDHPHRPAA